MTTARFCVVMLWLSLMAANFAFPPWKFVSTVSAFGGLVQPAGHHPFFAPPAPSGAKGTSGSLASRPAMPQFELWTVAIDVERLGTQTLFLIFLGGMLVLWLKYGHLIARRASAVSRDAPEGAATGTNVDAEAQFRAMVKKWVAEHGPPELAARARGLPSPVQEQQAPSLSRAGCYRAKRQAMVIRLVFALAFAAVAAALIVISVSQR
jgi:hypothetical protein